MNEYNEDLVQYIPLYLDDKTCSGTYKLDMKSYAGYINVDKDKSKNNYLYYWFFEKELFKESDVGNIPLVIWLNGGPGASSLAGLFLENGPFLLEDQGNNKAKIIKNENGWNEMFHLMYWDQPVGTGFSYTNNDGYVKTEKELSEQFCYGLLGFFDRHPEYRKCDLYITGESYAGKYIPNIAKTITELNKQLPDDKKIRLVGLGLGDGWMYPKLQTQLQIDYGYEMGFVDTLQKKDVESMYNDFCKALESKDMKAAFNLGTNVSNAVLSYGGSPDIYDVRRWQDLPITNLKNYLLCDEVKTAIHSHSVWMFADASSIVAERLINDLMADVTGLFPDLIKNYRMLFYTGNFDMSCGFTGTEQILQSWNYNGWTILKRKVWTETSLNFKTNIPQTQGYIKGIDNLTQCVIPDSGHQVPVAKPKVSRSMINKWIFELDFPGYIPVTVQAKTKWMDTGITLSEDKNIILKYLSGTWTANPATGFVDASGNSKYIAKTGYTLPGENEGALCGKIGDSGDVFLIGKEKKVKPSQTSNLFLCINDDLDGKYGAGFSDNEGTLSVAIAVNP
jgi:vitellogenic carboxypeptidase-like protein